MIEFNSNRINGLKCFEVTVSWHHHGTNVRPTVEASIAYLTEGKAAGMATSNEFSEEVLTKAQQLVEAIESEFLKGVGGSEDDTSEEAVRTTIKGLVDREF